VVTGILSKSRSARGSGTIGPSPRQTLAVGTSSRMWLNDQRVCGNLPLDPSMKRTVLSGGGGKPCITVLAFGSDCAALGSFGASSARAAKVRRLMEASARRKAMKRGMAFSRRLLFS